MLEERKRREREGGRKGGREESFQILGSKRKINLPKQLQDFIWMLCAIGARLHHIANSQILTNTLCKR